MTWARFCTIGATLTFTRLGASAWTVPAGFVEIAGMVLMTLIDFSHRNPIPAPLPHVVTAYVV
jgi:hypothetical protein